MTLASMAAAAPAGGSIMLADRIHWRLVSGEAIGLTGWKSALAITVGFVFGTLQTIRAGICAPCMATGFALGRHRKTAFPVMMTATAMPMAAGNARFVREKAYDPKAALTLALFGVIGVLIAADVVRSLPFDMMKWVVWGVVLYTSAVMFLSARQCGKAPSAERHRLSLTEGKRHE